MLLHGYNTQVLREGNPTSIPIACLVVGDIVLLESGDKIPADGLYIKGDDTVSNESPLTGFLFGEDVS